MLETVCEKGMVAAKHPLAASAGVEMLKKGGNAVDAAVAAAFAVGVAEPFASGLGGGGTMIIHLQESGEDMNIDFVPRVPSRAKPGMFELESGVSGMYSWRSVKDNANLVGYRSVLVPGAVAGLSLALEKYGTLELSVVMQPAITIAERGFNVSTYTEICIAQEMESFIGYSEWSRIYLRRRRFPYRAANLDPVVPADLLIQADLARTLRKVARDGPDAFYRGEIARAIAEDMDKNGGTITSSDLAIYEPRMRRPHHGEYREYEVVTAPIHGGATVMEMLNILSEFDLKSAGHNSARSLGYMAQAMKLAFSDRLDSLWDPDSENVPTDRILSKEHASELARSIKTQRGSKRSEGGRKRNLAEPQSGHTTHLTTVDKERNTVSLTNTLGGVFGSGIVAKGTGVVINNGMFWFNPVPGTLSSIRPGKWPMTAMSPVVLLKGERRREKTKTFLSVGAPGARRIMCAVMQSIVNVVDFGLTIQEAIAAPRIDYSSDLLISDVRIPESTTSKLESVGYEVLRVGQEISSFNFASPTGIMVDDDDKLHGGVDPYKPDNVAIGY